MDTITLIPPYGRDYRTKAEVEEAFHLGYDFRIADISHPYNGKYCSIRDLCGYEVTVRYNQLSNSIIIKN